MIAYGGGGPLHGVDLARRLGIRTVIIPPQPGNFSALGMLFADLRMELSRTLLGRLDEALTRTVDTVFRDMERELASKVASEFGAVTPHLERFLELRFVGQQHTVRVRVDGELRSSELHSGFFAAYEDRYGHVDTTPDVELVALGTVATVDLAKPDLHELSPTRIGTSTPATRSIRFEPTGTPYDTRVLRREELPRGWSAPGPVVIEEYGSTTIVGPSDSARIGSVGEIVINVGRQDRETAR